MSKPTFTKMHYDIIYEHTGDILATCDHEDGKWIPAILAKAFALDNVDADSIRAGIRYYHETLGKLFQEDNPKFNPKKWVI
mgnify:CR=1 FL=1